MSGLLYERILHRSEADVEDAVHFTHIPIVKFIQNNWPHLQACVREGLFTSNRGSFFAVGKWAWKFLGQRVWNTHLDPSLWKALRWKAVLISCHNRLKTHDVTGWGARRYWLALPDSWFLGPGEPVHIFRRCPYLRLKNYVMHSKSYQVHC